ncbi:hypothetical protein [Lactovum odontotermitis]
MSAKLFTNTIVINKNKQIVKFLLENVQNILKWDNEIIDVAEIDAQEFMVLRNQAAFNHQETIKVLANDDEIIYNSTEGRIEYRLVWKIKEIDENTTRLSQNLYLEKGIYGGVARLMKSVVKSAFAGNLQALKRICELGIVV